MDTIGKRIYQLRKTLGLSMEKFGEKICITKSSVNSLEKDVNTPSEQTFKLICMEYNVDPFWLETGVGDMFTAIPETIIDTLIDEFDLDDNDRLIIETYLQASKEQQATIKDFLLSLAKKVQKKEE